MPVIAFISPKGGAGKTTAALVLALGLEQRGGRVAMIDSDPNKPLVHWSGLPGRPDGVTVHAAPTSQDIGDAVREARRRRPDWLILDTEGSQRGAMAFTVLRPDLILTPLSGSRLEALQAVTASEMIRAFGARGGLAPTHRCLLTRIPPGADAQTLDAVTEHLRLNAIALAPTVLFDNDAFRALFTFGGSLATLRQAGVSGAAAAERNAGAYVEAVLSLLPAAPSSDLAPAPVT